MAGIARYQRVAMLEVLPADYVRTARAKGLPERDVVWRHALRTALTPDDRAARPDAPRAVSAAHSSSRRSSRGRAWAARRGRDRADATTIVVTATVIIGAVMVVVGNLIADLLHVALDPRVRE